MSLSCIEFIKMILLILRRSEMMKELLVMVSEEFRKEYHNTTGKIYRNLKSGVESFMSE